MRFIAKYVTDSSQPNDSVCNGDVALSVVHTCVAYTIDKND